MTAAEKAIVDQNYKFNVNFYQDSDNVIKKCQRHCTLIGQEDN